MNTYKIYKYTNLITGMSYIGQTCQTLKERAGLNMSKYIGCEKFWEAIQHYGTDCWRDEILWDGLTLDEANIYEQIEIRDNETLYPYGYNLSEGGMGVKPSQETRDKIRKANTGKKHSPESRRKMSDAAKGRKFPPDVIKKMAEKRKGEKHYLFGKTRSKETRRKISEAQKGKKLSKEHRRKISEGNKGRVCTDETKRKISEANTGRKHSAEARANMSTAQKSNPSRGFLNKKHSQEARRKMSKSRKGVTPWIKSKTHSKSTREKIREARKHQIMKPVSADTREKLRKASTGRTYSKESRQKMSDAAKGRPAHNKSAIWDNVEEIIRLYTVELKTTKEIALMYGLTDATSVRTLLKSNGIKLSRSRKPVRCDIWNNQDEVIRLYTVENKQTPEIANRFGVCTATVLKVLRSNGVKIIRKRSPETRKKISASLKASEKHRIASESRKGRSVSEETRRKLSTIKQSPERKETYKVYLSLPKDLTLPQKRKILREQFPNIPNYSILRWTKQWQSESDI